MINLLLDDLCNYLEQNIEDCSFFVGYLPGRDATVQKVNHGVYITLLTITEDVSVKIPFEYVQDSKRNFTKQEPPIILELGIMISAYLQDYVEGLKAISKVVQKLADKKKFVTDDFSYTLSIYNLTIDQSNNLWQALSTNILPNVMYKIRHVHVYPAVDEQADTSAEVVELTVKTGRQ